MPRFDREAPLHHAATKPAVRRPAHHPTIVAMWMAFQRTAGNRAVAASLQTRPLTVQRGKDGKDGKGEQKTRNRKKGKDPRADGGEPARGIRAVDMLGPIRSMEQFATQVSGLRKLPGQDAITMPDFVGRLVAYANDLLVEHYCPPLKLELTDSGSIASFNRVEWVVRVNQRAISRRQVSTLAGLTPDEVIEVAKSVYHEVRHAQQAFNIAQLLAGRGKSTDKILATMIRPIKEKTVRRRKSELPNVIGSAAKLPAKGRRRDPLGAQVKLWHDFTVGKYRKYTRWVHTFNNEIAKLENRRKVGDEAERQAAARELVQLLDERKLSHAGITDSVNKLKTSPTTQDILEWLRRIGARIEPLQQSLVPTADTDKGPAIAAALGLLGFELRAAYRNFAHERDTFAIEDSVGIILRRESARS